MSEIKDETIEQKTHRMIKSIYGDVEYFPTLENISVYPEFIKDCKLVELAIAEEREAGAKICEENIELRKAITFCYGALIELSPCADDRCKQFQSESLSIAISKIEELNKAEVSE